MSTPATPITGTADTHPLVTVETYARVTTDNGPAPTAMEHALNDALDLLQRQMRRTFLYAQYTERLFMYSNGMVYPSANPIDVSKPISTPNGASPPGGSIGVVQGAGVWVGSFVSIPSLPLFVGVVPPQTDITYWGGWTGPDGPGPTLPSQLVRIICRTAWYILHPSALEALPAGAKSASVGGVSVSGDLSAIVVSDPQLERDIARWRKPQVRGWGGQVTPVR